MEPGGTTHPHPAYPFAWCEPMGSPPVVRGSGQGVLLGDEVASTAAPSDPLGVVTDIHGQTFGDGNGDTITVIPAAVTLSTGDRYAVADLVLLRRAEA